MMCVARPQGQSVVVQPEQEEEELRERVTR